MDSFYAAEVSGIYFVTFTNQIVDLSNNPLSTVTFSFTVKQLIYSKQVSATNGAAYGYGVSTDSSGNIYVAGYTSTGISGQTRQGYNDYFLAKYDSSGNLLFTRQVGAPNGFTYGFGVSTDSSDNIYVTGFTSVGISGQTQQGTRDYFLVKYDSSGNLLFTRQVGASGGTTSGYGVSTDISGNIYVTGLTNQGLSGQTQQGIIDYFLAKYDSSGNLIFTRQVGASGGSTFGYGVSTDSSGNVYVTGETDVGISGQTQQGYYDYFLAKYQP